MLGNSGRVALVTGANRGIGFEVAGQLGRLGYVPILAARDRSLGEAAVGRLARAGIAAECVELNVTDQASVRAAAEEVDRRHGRLHALVNNAAIAVDDARPSRLAVDAFRRTFETNVIGVFTVTTMMLPLLRAAGGSRIVNVSSGSASLALTSSDWPDEWNAAAYPASKTAVNALTVQFATELRPTGIKVNAVDPGYTLTDMSPGATRTAAEAAAIVVRYATLGDDGPTGGFFNADGPVPW
ncbi:SDR family NAD(P)-dependent oxidoreductase [Hamadaea tsunoensis]|uniref:SDR family NAD(P)-dependent oxidoreductase n=1 Tax=Hamadaea tsunoensis TaxID=53368 RepID=UPI000482CDFB|nr:SDR family NAD(P)-dependent oxidoreductase [Hamadaea tsunoensis]